VTIHSAVSRRLQDLRQALTTIPDWRTWRTCALVYACFLAAALPIGLRSGLLRPTPPRVSPIDMAAAGVLLFLQPALVEEIVFRGLLLPRNRGSMRRGRLAVVAGAALMLYVASHPINAWLFRPQALDLFAGPVYLALATLLGLACTLTYLISRSIWPPVAVHWLTVVTWIWFLGGQALLC